MNSLDRQMLLQEEMGKDRTITLLANRRRSPELTMDPNTAQDLEEVKSIPVVANESRDLIRKGEHDERSNETIASMHRCVRMGDHSGVVGVVSECTK
jgi:hypothetical protein